MGGVEGLGRMERRLVRRGEERRRRDDEREERPGMRKEGRREGGRIRWWSLFTDCRSRSGQSISAGA